MVMEESDSEIVERAVVWQRAVAGDAVDWAAFTEWLEADSRHRDAFDDIALIDSAVDTHRGALRTLLRPSARDDTGEATEHRSTGRRWFLGTGIAAALALVVGLPLIQSQQTRPVAYETSPGTTRSVTLDDGSRFALSADTAVSVDHRQRRVTIVRGAVYFDVRHDPARQLIVEANGYRIADIGTRFSVDLAGEHVSIAVAQGMVIVAPPAGEPMRLEAGDAVTGNRDGSLARANVVPDAVASWRHGRLLYDNVALATVARDISRYTGERITVAVTAGDRGFSGVLVIGDGSHLVSDFAAVADLAVERSADRVVLSPKHS
ncbi:FecR family protein [Hephaestia sp. GCM10023244]|uniref:FecR family protein n=1 Tax=unclassified Hephaestia TaxID=2631281 RepID=UPI0020774A26|nr:FecR domain-containing protein [Hephaestia sp. MAHUQ-44]MCM8732523.1 FecR domain-containing protein [Hephaestia sp. MAHUQ-44]